MADGRYDINGDGVVDVTDVQSLATKILNGEGGKVSVGDAAKYALSASQIGMVADNPSKAANNATALAKAISCGATALVIDGTYHVTAAQIECGHPLLLIGGKLVIHRHKEWYYWLIKISDGFQISCTDVEFEGVCDSGISETAHFHVFGNDTNVASTNPAYGADYTVNVIHYSGCKFTNVNALKLVFKVNEQNDGKGAYSDCGIGDLLAIGCTFDNSSLAIMGGLIKERCEIANCRIINLNGGFFTHDRNVTGAVTQFKHNKPIVFHDNYLSTIKYAAAEYVTSLIVKGHAARVYNNIMDGFLGLSVSDEDKALMLADDNLKQYIHGKELCSMYDVYLSVAELEYYGNEITNLIAFRLSDNRTYPYVSTCYSKQRYETHAYKHIHRNKWRWDEQKCKAILSDAYDNILKPLSDLRKEKGLKPYDISKEKWIEQQYITSIFDYVNSFDEIVFDDNEIYIPNGIIKGVSMINSPCAAGRYEIVGNRIDARRLEGALCRFMPRHTTKSAAADTEVEGKTIEQWAKEVEAIPVTTWKSSGYPVRYIADNGEVVKITQGTKTTWFPSDLFSIVKDGETWQILYHECPSVMIAHNWFEMGEKDRFVTLFKGVANMPTMGNDGYFSDFIRHPYGEVYIMRNYLNTAYYADPCVCQNYREYGNEIPSGISIQHHPFATASWRDMWARQMGRQSEVEAMLPSSLGKEGGNNITLTNYLTMGNKQTWVCLPQYTKDNPMRFTAWYKDGRTRTLRLEYYKNGERITKQMTMSGHHPVHVVGFDGKESNVEYYKALSVQGADVTVQIVHGYTGGSTTTGVQVNYTYINIYDYKGEGRLWLTWIQ